MRNRSNECPSCGDDLTACECGAGPVIIDLKSKIAEAVGLLGPIKKAAIDEPFYNGSEWLIHVTLNTGLIRNAAAFVAENGESSAS